MVKQSKTRLTTLKMSDFQCEQMNQGAITEQNSSLFYFNTTM